MAKSVNNLISEMYSDPDFKAKGDYKPDKGAVKAEEMTVNKYTGSRFGRFAKKFGAYISDHSADIKYLLLAVPIIAIFLFAWKSQEAQSLLTGASTHQAKIFFKTNPASIPPEQTAEIWVNADSPVGFADLELSFNPDLVKLTNEISTFNLNKKIVISTMGNSNSTGKITVVLALDPAQRANPPSGAFELASFKLNANTSGTATSSVAFKISSMELTSMDTADFTVSTANLSLNINPTPTPTLTPIPTPTFVPTPSPTQTPVPTKSPTPTPSKTPSPTYTPVPTPTPVTNYLLSGIVSDSSTNALLSGVSVKLQKTTDAFWRFKTIKTDSYGHYGVYLSPGSYKITITKSGYSSFQETIDLADNTILDFSLTRSKNRFYTFFYNIFHHKNR